MQKKSWGFQQLGSDVYYRFHSQHSEITVLIDISVLDSYLWNNDYRNFCYTSHSLYSKS